MTAEETPSASRGGDGPEPGGGSDPEPGGVTLRPMRAEDLDPIAALELDLYPNPWRREHFASLLDHPAAVTWVAARGDRVVGYAVSWVAADEAELANLAVDRSWQGRGIGSRLLTRTAAAARERGAATLWLEVRVSNTAARSLYTRHGFRVVGRRRGMYHHPREDALVMSADLRAAPLVDPAPGAG